MNIDLTWGVYLTRAEFERSYPDEIEERERFIFYGEIEHVRVVLTDRRIEVSAGEYNRHINEDDISTGVIWPRSKLKLVVANVPSGGNSPLRLALNFQDTELVLTMPQSMTYEEAMRVARKVVQ
ncbi:hypothetical protein AB5I39_09955 [Sphingomonas sp. MMS24-J45]|uniref:hypothetical protein n=1 Tax=Sphingomonas sp. MMS24-J45 TaxID=3238806 RepID=UPI00384AA6D3